MPWICRAAVGLLCVGIVSLPLPALSSDAIRSLLNSGDAQRAWELAEQRVAQQAGEPEFDFWCGMAALESGHAEQAVFAFERVLLARPNHHRARLELARSHYLIGNTAAAHAQFQAVLDIDPPPNVRQRVSSFLAAIERAERSARVTYQGFAELRAGHDSNINSATTDPSIAIPALGEVLLDDASRETDDEFWEASAGGRLNYPLSKFSSAFVNASLRQRDNLSSSTFDLRVASLSTGLALVEGRDRVRVPVAYQKLWLDDEAYRTLTSVGMTWSRELDTRKQVSLFAQAGAFRYDEQTSLDTNLKLAGAGWTQRWPGTSLLAAVSLYVGDEIATRARFDFNGKFYYGLRAALEWQRWPRHRPYASLTLQQSEHDGSHPVFGQRREDDFGEVRIGWLWQMTDDWSLRAEYSHIENDSTLSIFEYDRDQFFMGVRYGFL